MMSEEVLLSGKVKIWRLPEVQPGVNEAGLKRLMLPQGELAQFYDDEEGVRYIASIELKAGTVRGNHYHKIKREYVYVLAGKLRLVVQELGNGRQEEMELEGGSLVFIEPGIVHALDVKESGVAVEFSVNRFDSGDTYREKLV
jgi:quercetin dioxygenase-like cupin family protein